jgi:molybdate transport system substrate-binding protein
MPLERRRIVLAVPAVPLVTLATPAEAETTDLILNCDAALAGPMAAAAKRSAETHRVLLNIFPTPSGLILPQIARHIQNDMVVTKSTAIVDAITAETITAHAPQGGHWRNRLVIAGRTGAKSSVVACVWGSVTRHQAPTWTAPQSPKS